MGFSALRYHKYSQSSTLIDHASGIAFMLGDVVEPFTARSNACNVNQKR